MKCNQIGCDNVATHRVFWPGNHPLPTCKEHVAVAEGIGRALGIYVHIEEIPHDTGREGESNRQDTKGEVY